MAIKTLGVMFVVTTAQSALFDPASQTEGSKTDCRVQSAIGETPCELRGPVPFQPTESEPMKKKAKPAELKCVVEAAELTLLGYRGIDFLARAVYIEIFPQDSYLREFDLVDKF